MTVNMLSVFQIRCGLVKGLYLSSHLSSAYAFHVSFCGLGLLFCNWVARKPLPQKVCVGGPNSPHSSSLRLRTIGPQTLLVCCRSVCNRVQIFSILHLLWCFSWFHGKKKSLIFLLCKKLISKKRFKMKCVWILQLKLWLFHNKGPVNSNRQKCALAIHQIHKDYEHLRQNFL